MSHRNSKQKLIFWFIGYYGLTTDEIAIVENSPK